MHEKLELLLNQINMTKEYYAYFKNGNLDKIVGNKNKDTYTFFITLETILPLDIYLDLLKLLQAKYLDYKVKLELNCVDNSLYAVDYYGYYIDKYAVESPLIATFKESFLNYTNNVIELEMHNKAETMKFDSIKEALVKDLATSGFGDIKINISINTNKNNEVAEELKKLQKVDLKPKVKKENKIILGEEIKTKITPIKEIIMEDNSMAIEAYIFGIDFFDSPKSSVKIITFKVSDNTDSIYAKLFVREKDEFEAYKDKFKIGNWYKFKGYTKNDSYSKELVLFPRDINISGHIKDDIKTDTAANKRVELHAHTFMSQMDGLIEPSKLVQTAYNWGHKAIAITDHNSVQAFPDVFHTVCDINKKLDAKDHFKALYGVELTMIDDTVDIVLRPDNTVMLDNTYVVFDFETTGFNAGGGDQIIEVGAVKLINGEITDTFSQLINPKRTLPVKITEITGITDAMLVDADNEEEVIKRFMAWADSEKMVAHNAKFDLSFLEMAYKKYNLGVFKNTVIDTLELSRALDPDVFRHSLSALVKRYEVPFDENDHHRGDYDAKATAIIFNKMMQKLNNRNLVTVNDLNKLISKDEIFKFGRAFHVNLIAKNKVGLKNLFKIVSLANTKYIFKTPRIPRSEIIALREGLIVGSGCYECEVFIQARSKSEEELNNIVSFYDYVEVQPIDIYTHLVQMDDFANNAEVTEHVKKIIRVTEDAGKIIVATGDVHHLAKDDRIYRQIVVNQKVPGGGRHPLSKTNIKNIPFQHLRTTDEMLADFNFLSDELAHKLVIDNPNKIVDMVEEIEVIMDTKGVPFSPKIENSAKIVEELVYIKAHEIYGPQLPATVLDRIEKELSGIIKGGFDVIYLIAHKLVKKSNDDGYLVGSRGSVGSSFVATLLGITEVNPLVAHYICPGCKHSIFEINSRALSEDYSSGFDLPDLACPVCKTNMLKDGQDIPFATFLGFDADKVPDIDLNFSGDYQQYAHDYTKELFGEDNVFRAGTIGTVADKTAFGFVKGYCEDNGIVMRTAETERLALGCTGVKRTTGQHPGGIVVVPNYMDVFDFTPYQYPADDATSSWKTTHFDYHAIDQNLLKLDILGHDDPTILKILQDMTKIDILTIPFDDKKVLSLFRSPTEMGITKEMINCETGTLGIPEFGTTLTINMLKLTQPETFAELVKLSGLSHGTDVWSGNAEELIRTNVCDFKEVIGCRDDIMLYLMQNGMSTKDSFKIMEFVRKGKPSKEKDAWEGFKEQMKQAGIVDWYIDSCYKIKYMFPKAHAAAYVMSAYRIAWFKLYYPIEYYAAYFAVRANEFDLTTMIKGYDAIKNKINEIIFKGREATKKELDTLDTLQIAMEASARKIKFSNVNILKSDSRYFVVEDDTLIPPFRSLEGLGETVSNKIVEERTKQPFISIQDFQRRGKVSSTLIDKMRVSGALADMDESSQLSLF